MAQMQINRLLNSSRPGAAPQFRCEQSAVLRSVLPWERRTIAIVLEPRALLIEEDEKHHHHFGGACTSIGVALDLAQTSPDIKQFYSTQFVGLIYQVYPIHFPGTVCPHVEDGLGHVRCLLDRPRLLGCFLWILGVNFDFPNDTKPQDQSSYRY
jgi:hypothetical protein